METRKKINRALVINAIGVIFSGLFPKGFSIQAEFSIISANRQDQFTLDACRNVDGKLKDAATT